MNRKSMLGLSLLAMAMSEQSNYDRLGMGKPISEIDFTPKEAPTPKGCKEYYFNYSGDFINKNDGVYCFKCIASNDRNAIKKFNNWVKKTTQPQD